MQNEVLKKLQQEVVIKQQELQQLSTKIQQALALCAVSEKSAQLDSQQSQSDLMKAICTLQQENKELKDMVEQFISEQKKEFREFSKNVEEMYGNRFKEMNTQLKKKEKQIKQTNLQIEKRGRIIEEKALEISVLREKLKNNMNFIIDNCELHVTDLEPNEQQQSVQESQHEENESSSSHYEHQQSNQQSNSNLQEVEIEVCEQNQEPSIEYPQALFQEQEQQQFDKLFYETEENQQLSCPTSFRIQHFNKAPPHSQSNTFQMRQNRDSSNVSSSKDLKNQQNLSSQGDNDYFWKNLTCHISNNRKNCTGVKGGNRENQKSKIGGKDKEMLMTKITDFRKMLFLDKGITRFGFK